MSKQAWVTLATNDSYALGALVLAHSLKRVSSANPAVVLITPSVTESMRGRLGAVFAEVVTVDVLDSRDAAHLALLARPELGITFTKLHCWNLTQYDKCVFLDADTLVVQNCDELFEREELSAAPDVGWPDCFNSGVFVYSPSADTFAKLLAFAKERGSFDGGDQGLLNSYFSSWAHADISKHLPFLYNVTSVAFYSYLPALKQYGQDVKIVHFIGNNKPWLANFNWESRSVDAPAHLQPTLQLWWDIFVSGVHSQLDTAMAEEQSFQTHYQPHTSHYQYQVNPHSEFPWHREAEVEPTVDDEHHKYIEQCLAEFCDPWENYRGNIPQSGDRGNEHTEIQARVEVHHTVNIEWDSYKAPAHTPQEHSHQEPGSHRQNHSDPPSWEQPKHNHSQTHNQHSHQHLHEEQSQKAAHTGYEEPTLTYTEDRDPMSATTVYRATSAQNEPFEKDEVVCNGDVSLNYESAESDTETNETDEVRPRHPYDNYYMLHQCIMDHRGRKRCSHEPPSAPPTPPPPPEEPPQVYTEQAGLAGTMARLTLGAPASQQPALDEHTRRQGWEAGNIDYLGADSFANIWAKISATLAQAPSPPAAEPAISPVPQEVKAEEPGSPAPALESEPTPAPAQVEKSPEPQLTAAEVAPPSEPVAEAFTAPASAPAEPVAPPVEAPVEAVKVAEPEATPVQSAPTEPVVAPEVLKSEEQAAESPATPPAKPVEAPVTEAPTVAAVAQVTPSKEAPQSSTDSPPLVSTPVKDAVSPKSAEEGESDTATEEQAPRTESRKAPPTDKLSCQLKPSAESTLLLTPDSELEDADTLAQSIIASELGIPHTPQVTSATPPILPAALSLTDTKQLSVEEPELPTPPVSLAQIGILPSKPEVPAETTQSPQCPVAEIAEDDFKSSDEKITKELETTTAPVASAELVTSESKVSQSAPAEEPILAIPTPEKSRLEDESNLETKPALDLKAVEPAAVPETDATATMPASDAEVAELLPEPKLDASAAEVAVPALEPEEFLSSSQAESTSATEVIAASPTPKTEVPVPTPESKLDEVIPEPKVDASELKVAMPAPEQKDSSTSTESAPTTEAKAAPPMPEEKVPAPKPEAMVVTPAPEAKVVTPTPEAKVTVPAQEPEVSPSTPQAKLTPANEVKAAPLTAETKAPTPESNVTVPAPEPEVSPSTPQAKPTPANEVKAAPLTAETKAPTPEAKVTVPAPEPEVSPSTPQAKPTPANEVKAAPLTAEIKARKPEPKVAPKPEIKLNTKTSLSTPTPKKEAAVKLSEEVTTELSAKTESAQTAPVQPTASDTLSKTEEACSESKPEVAAEPRKKKVVKKIVKKESTESSEKGSGSSEPASPATPVPPPRKKEKKPAEKK